MALAGLQANQIITMFDVFSLTQTCSNANAMVATNGREREMGLLCSLVSYLYPFPWTDVTVGLKLLRFEKVRNESELSVLIERLFGLYIELQEDTPNPRLEGYDYNTLILSLTPAWISECIL